MSELQRSILIVAAMLLPSFTAGAQEARLLRYDPQRVMDESQSGQSAHAELRAEFESKQAQLDRLVALVREGRTRIASMPADDPRRAEAERRLREMEARCNALFVRFREELRQRERARVEEVLRCADAQAEHIRQARGASGVTREAAPLSGEDITREVIQRLDDRGCEAPRAM